MGLVGGRARFRFVRKEDHRYGDPDAIQDFALWALHTTE